MGWLDGYWRMKSDWPRCPVTGRFPFTDEIRLIDPYFNPDSAESRAQTCRILREKGVIVPSLLQRRDITYLRDAVGE